jgi:hypothetical protein
VEAFFDILHEEIASTRAEAQGWRIIVLVWNEYTRVQGGFFSAKGTLGAQQYFIDYAL